VIAPEVGPEVLTGSTRLKAGTSQKMVLNMLSTAVMARLGHVYENLMIDMMLTNEKLAERALRILSEASGKKVSAAEHALRAAGHDMRVALVMLKLGVGAAEARKKLNGGIRGTINAEVHGAAEGTEKSKKGLAKAQGLHERYRESAWISF
jgi:N-acetylmuramic acid 6-phosphate etherase